MSASTEKVTPAVTLYSFPISNYAARVRYLVYHKDLVTTNDVEIVPLSSFETYHKINPLRRIPAAIVNSTDKPLHLYESVVIVDYLAERYADVGKSFIPASAEDRARARMICAVLNEYIGPHHPYMYKRNMEGDRAAEVAKMQAGFDVIEGILDESGPYAVGTGLSSADCALWGNWPFYAFMLPTFFGWSAEDGRPKLAAWARHMCTESQAARDVYSEVHGALQSWWDGGRWNTLGMNALQDPPGLPF